MPKKKTKKSLAKRIKITKKGKITRRKAGVSHLLSKKKKKRKRHLRKKKVLEGGSLGRLRRLLTS
ncbi:50S ribosomal protein L35 [candidate division WOR-3 bacterium]|uniref:Large ribosomal subunit protein bL35 n=1 Tax=candidate division WOR-3 bacterium TaxID=2052148 RepID=A0A660SL32_UNCW3|nr:MAG: 50S ribosomal protein L35 [candidate division WOR-3 bacterium]